MIIPIPGNVDTIQIPIDKMWYYSQQLPATDLVRMKNDPYYRARLVQQSTEALATVLDAEIIDLLISAAAGQKGATIELEVPKHYNPQKHIDLYLTFADTATSLEKKINSYYRGAPRKEIMCLEEPYLYTRMIKSLGGFYLAIEKALSFIQNEEISASKISGMTIVRHIFLDNHVPAEISSDFGFYNFTGYRAIIYFIAAPFLYQVMHDSTGVIDKDTGNYRLIQRGVYGKGAIYGDLIRVIKDPSTLNKPLPFEKHLIENRDEYNKNYGFKDQYIEIPSTLKELQDSYDKSNLDQGENKPKNPDHAPENWQKEELNDIKVEVKTYQNKIEKLILNDNQTCWRAGEEEYNKKDGIINHKNWYNFTEAIWRN